ncbi:hypothetical protein F511_38963 [Dorcoceras hygrometricum]|uniref:Endosulphine n=1 Tax=Dorcoceras hygrometricum TaxID=472368 RepID=A0A2Z7B547_9LAMI|nr:hypothetical protein F511_43551 [Dorcoceras hygrometricum]KZV32037.1 hypothetical protein F511_38963 [Dorcoceras hygrometricum]
MADDKNNEPAEVISGDDPKVEAEDSSSHEDFKEMESPKQEEEKIKKKYGGLLPKKPPLISNDKEHAFFDSADWVLVKAGAQKSKGPLEALRPKLQKSISQPTPHHQARSVSAYAHATDGGEESVDSDNVTHAENQESQLDAGSESSKNTIEDQNKQN